MRHASRESRAGRSRVRGRSTSPGRFIRLSVSRCVRSTKRPRGQVDGVSSEWWGALSECVSGGACHGDDGREGWVVVRPRARGGGSARSASGVAGLRRDFALVSAWQERDVLYTATAADEPLVAFVAGRGAALLARAAVCGGRLVRSAEAAPCPRRNSNGSWGNSWNGSAPPLPGDAEE